MAVLQDDLRFTHAPTYFIKALKIALGSECAKGTSMQQSVKTAAVDAMASIILRVSQLLPAPIVRGS